MRVKMLNPFWLRAGDPDWLSSPIWAQRDAEWEAREAQVHAAEALTLEQWMRLGEAERGAVVELYAARRPRPASIAA